VIETVRKIRGQSQLCVALSRDLLFARYPDTSNSDLIANIGVTLAQVQLHALALPGQMHPMRYFAKDWLLQRNVLCSESYHSRMK
jgi:hypothetical protein